MYHYIAKKGMLPSVFYSLPYGERLILRACFELEMEEPKRTCPLMEVR